MPVGFRLVIASGKGGTGKTTLATALAAALARSRTAGVTLVDCDVEQPNDFLFHVPSLPVLESVGVPSPIFDRELCTRCRECVSACRFSALAMVRDGLLYFPELCHGCGACWEVCPAGAVKQGTRHIGTVKSSDVLNQPHLHLIWGELDVGQLLAPPLIDRARQMAEDRADAVQILDAPPGTACPFVTAVRDTDCCLLVTEPTPFGLHDLRLAVEVVEALRVPAAVVLNRSDIADPAAIEQYCLSHHLSLLLRIPFSAQTARILSRGGTLLDADPAWESQLITLWDACARIARGAAQGRHS